MKSKYRVVQKPWGAYYPQEWSWFSGWYDLRDDGFQTTEAAIKWIRQTENQGDVVTWSGSA